MTKSELIRKQDAADLLGVSVSTFDRRRGQWGLEPVPRAIVKPVFFDRATVLAVKFNTHGLSNGQILSLAEIKRKAGRKGRAK